MRERGYAIDDEETFEGGRYIAAPIYDHGQQLIGSMGISGPSISLIWNKLTELASVVVKVPRQASTSLGAYSSAVDSDESNSR